MAGVEKEKKANTDEVKKLGLRRVHVACDWFVSLAYFQAQGPFGKGVENDWLHALHLLVLHPM